MDYLFVGIVLFFAMDIVFFILGLDVEKFWTKILFFMLTTMLSFSLCGLWIATLSSYSIVYMLLFFFIGFMSFILIIYYSLASYGEKSLKQWEI